MVKQVKRSIFDRARANAKLASERVEREIESSGGIKPYRETLKQRASKTGQTGQPNIFQAASENIEQISASDS